MNSTILIWYHKSSKAQNSFMDSALCIHYGALPLPSTKSLTMVPRLRSDFSPSSLSFSSNGCTHRTSRGYAFSPVVTAINKCSAPSTNGKEDKRLMQRSIGGASLVLACVLGIMNCNYKFTPRAIAAPREGHRRAQSSDQQDILSPKTAKDVLRSLLMVNVNVASRPPAPSKWKKFHKKLKVPPNFSMQDCEDLKVNAAALIKAGKSDEAEKQLQEIYDTLVTEGGGKISESAYHVQMALVAILIFQGKYFEAAKCDCLKKAYAIPSDGRVHLYKAIIHTMLDENKEAKECWETFVGFLDNEDMPNSPPRSKPKHKVF